MIEILLKLLIAGVCGAIGQRIAGSDRRGCLTAVVVGFIGAFLGGAMSAKVNLPDPMVIQVGGESFPILW